MIGFAFTLMRIIVLMLIQLIWCIAYPSYAQLDSIIQQKDSLHNVKLDNQRIRIRQFAAERLQVKRLFHLQFLRMQ